MKFACKVTKKYQIPLQIGLKNILYLHNVSDLVI